jgi:hypothetical protein
MALLYPSRLATKRREKEETHGGILLLPSPAPTVPANVGTSIASSLTK